jgi:hypothetical protein
MFADPKDSYTILASSMPGKPGPGGDAEPEEGEAEDDEEE